MVIFDAFGCKVAKNNLKWGGTKSTVWLLNYDDIQTSALKVLSINEGTFMDIGN